MLTGIPMLKRMIEREAAESFDLSNSTTIEVATASFRSTRGYAMPLRSATSWHFGKTIITAPSRIMKSSMPFVPACYNVRMRCCYVHHRHMPAKVPCGIHTANISVRTMIRF